MKIRTIARAWAAEAWLNLRYQPWRLLPHLHRPAPWWAASDFTCSWCGSSSPRVQRKGRRQASREGLVS